MGLADRSRSLEETIGGNGCPWVRSVLWFLALQCGASQTQWTETCMTPGAKISQPFLLLSGAWVTVMPKKLTPHHPHSASDCIFQMIFSFFQSERGSESLLKARQKCHSQFILWRY